MTDAVQETTVDRPSRPYLVRHILRLFRADWFRAVALFVVTMVIHFPALDGEMIWDDSYLARANPFIKSPLLALEAFRHHLLSKPKQSNRQS